MIILGEEMALFQEAKKKWVSFYLAYIGFIIFGVVLEFIKGSLTIENAILIFLAITGVMLIAYLLIWITNKVIYFVKKNILKKEKTNSNLSKDFNVKGSCVRNCYWQRGYLKGKILLRNQGKISTTLSKVSLIVGNKEYEPQELNLKLNSEENLSHEINFLIFRDKNKDNADFQKKIEKEGKIRFYHTFDSPIEIKLDFISLKQ